MTMIMKQLQISFYLSLIILFVFSILVFIAIIPEIIKKSTFFIDLLSRNYNEIYNLIIYLVTCLIFAK